VSARQGAAHTSGTRSPRKSSGSRTPCRGPPWPRPSVADLPLQLMLGALQLTPGVLQLTPGALQLTALAGAAGPLFDAFAGMRRSTSGEAAHRNRNRYNGLRESPFPPEPPRRKLGTKTLCPDVGDCSHGRRKKVGPGRTHETPGAEASCIYINPLASGARPPTHARAE
jgi:hypothetical protein